MGIDIRRLVRAEREDRKWNVIGWMVYDTPSKAVVNAIIKIKKDSVLVETQEVIYSTVTSCTGRRTCAGTPIFEEDTIIVICDRVSSSYGSWCRKVNKHHGQYELLMTVEYDTESGIYRLRPDPEAAAALEAPMGRERFEQLLQYPYALHEAKSAEIVGATEDMRWRQLHGR